MVGMITATRTHLHMITAMHTTTLTIIRMIIHMTMHHMDTLMSIHTTTRTDTITHTRTDTHMRTTTLPPKLLRTLTTTVDILMNTTTTCTASSYTLPLTLEARWPSSSPPP
jgi:hypothetical protein